MNGSLGIDIRREALEAFAAECEAIVADVNTGRHKVLSDYIGTTGTYTPVKWRDGVKVTLGTVDFPHTGKVAGEILADRTREASFAFVSVEEGMRALASIVRQALADFEGRDSVSADELTAIISRNDTARPLTTLEHP